MKSRLIHDHWLLVYAAWAMFIALMNFRTALTVMLVIASIACVVMWLWDRKDRKRDEWMR